MAKETAEEKKARKEAKREAAIEVRKLNKEIKLYPQLHPVASVAVRPIVGAAAAYGTAYADGRMGTEQNSHWASVAGLAVTGLGGIAAAAAGAPTLGAGLGDAAGGIAGWLSGSSGHKKGLEDRQKAGAPVPAG